MTNKRSIAALCGFVVAAAVFGISDGVTALSRLFTQRPDPIIPVLARSCLAFVVTWVAINSVARLRACPDKPLRRKLLLCTAGLLIGAGLVSVGWPLSTFHYRATEQAYYYGFQSTGSRLTFGGSDYVGTTYIPIGNISEGELVARHRFPALWFDASGLDFKGTDYGGDELRVHHGISSAFVMADSFEFVTPPAPPLVGTTVFFLGVLIGGWGFLALICCRNSPATANETTAAAEVTDSPEPVIES